MKTRVIHGGHRPTGRTIPDQAAPADARRREVRA